MVEIEEEKYEVEVEKNKEEELVENEKLEKEELEKKKREEKNKKIQEGKGKMKIISVQHLLYAWFLDIFSHLQINIPFSEALEQIPTYAKFMKDILTKKMRYTDQETINLDDSCTAIIQRTLPYKEIDLMRVILLVTIGNLCIGKSLIDLGSSINLISFFMVQRLRNIEMKSTNMTLQLVDKSITHLHGVAEDVLVKVDKFMFPIDFVVTNMEEDDDAPSILDQPFMKIARMMIDIDDGLMKVRVQDE